MWSNFEASTVEDETISNAFSSRSIFKISSEDEVINEPTIQASVQSGKMVISIDRSLLLLEDELVAKCSFLSFSAHIDAIAISSSGNLIVCGLSDGEVHGVYIKGLLLFSVCIRIEDVSISVGTFTSIQQLGQHFYFSCKNGSVYCLSKINESTLESVSNITLGDSEQMTALLDDVTIQRSSTGKAMSNVDTALLLKQPQPTAPHSYAENNQEADQRQDYDLIVTGAQGVIHFKTTSKDTSRINIANQYGGIKEIYNVDHYIIALTQSGHLLEICPFTRTVNVCQSSQSRALLIDDLQVMECSEENVELLILTKPTTDGERFIRIVEYPSLRCKNEVEVPQHAWLVRQPKSAVNLYYLATKELKSNAIPSEVEMMMVSETDPSDRFKKLIAKGRLEEAEDFGKQFELCLQPIFEARAKRILLELCNTSANIVQGNELDAKFEMLLKLLAQIESKAFIKNNRMMNLSSRHILERYLKEVKKRLDFEEDEDHLLEIDEQLHRLKTMAIIDPYECNSEWQKFVYNTNLVKVIKGMFNSDMATACLIWRRHSSNILPHLNEDELRTLLGFIPSDTEPLNVVQWLRQFVPAVSNTHPTIMPFITDWSIERTRKLQYSDHWPEIGLEFSTKILEIFEEIQFIYSDVRRQQERNIGKLRDLDNALQDLSVLKKRYKLNFTLDSYMQDSIDATALRILQRVHLDNLQSLVRDFLYPIYQEKGRQPLDVIKQYIAQLVANRQSLSNWLERAIACIELLHNEDSRLECALSILQNAPVPWPETLAPLIKLRNSTHPLSMKINAEYEIQVIKIMKVKYGWTADNASDINLELFMMRIVKLNLPDMLKDIRILTKAAPEISTSANFNCCYQMSRRGQIDMAYDFFKSLNDKTNAKQGNEVVDILANLLEMSSCTGEAKVQEHLNLLEFFKLLLPSVEPVYKRRYLLIKHRLQLRQKFNIQLNCSTELISLQKRLALLDEGIELIVTRAQASMNVCALIVNEMSELCTALDIEKVHGLLRISQCIGCLPLTCALAYYVIESISCVPTNKMDFINFGIELLVQQMNDGKSQNHDTHSSLQLLSENDPLCFPLVYELLTEALLHERSNQCDLTELIKYVRVAVIHYPLDAVEAHYAGKEQAVNEQICRALDGVPIALGETTLNFSTAVNNSIDMKPCIEPSSKKRYSVSMFDEVDVRPQEKPQLKKRLSGSLPIVKFLGRTLLLMILETEPKNSLLLQMQMSLPNNVKHDIDGARSDFFLSLEHLTKAKEHDVWYIMSQYLLEYQKHNRSKKIINEGFITIQLRRILRNAMNNKDANLIELFTMLVADTESRALLEKLSSEVKTDQQKITFLTLSAMYNEHIDEMDIVQNLRATRNKLYYYLEFCQQDPSIRGKFNPEMDNIEHLLNEFHNKRLNVHLLERMSASFKLDFQRMLITQILSILRAQELRYEIKRDSFGDEELVVLNSVREMREMCQPYINQIQNVKLFTSKLNELIEEINIYFYEMYLCVIEILMFFDAAPKQMEIWINILHFLRHKMVTRRCCRAGQQETDIWMQTQKDNGVLPKIARYRLPFKPLVEHPLRDILCRELNVDNCQSWFPLILMYNALKDSSTPQSCDYYITAAITNSIAEYKSKNDSESWSLHPTNNAFLKSILRLVKHVQSPSNVIFVLYYVASYARDGADQVEAFYEGWKYVKANQEVLDKDPKCQEQLAKIKRMYPIHKTQHLLHVYGLSEEKLMRLVENPTELIHSLYHHELILKSSKVDINALVKEICALHDLSLDAIQFKLLQKWLSVTMEPADGTIMEETFLEDQNWPENGSNGNCNGDETGTASENVVRAFYILSSWPKSEAVQFLVGLIFKGGSMNTSQQLQMYECYSKLNDGSTSFSNTLSQRQFITIKCVHELKALGYNSNIEKFADENCDKISIIKMVWQRNAQNPLSLEVMANICLGFDIHLPKIWNGIIKRMVMFNMVRELNALVDVLSCRPELLHLDGLAQAWNCVLCHPLKNAVPTRSCAQEERLQKTLIRLQGCPVVHALNLLQFAELCVLVRRPHMAAIVLIFCQNDEQRAKIVKLIRSRHVDNLRQDILELEDAGLLPMVLNFALKELQL
ncbi:uncharacterized protein LOC132785870 [Drosophila nasuta]|uniref:uncharacterized protein LOC132785870 n=1 Tax=Drosophila nasuta TaxID=42062 RepID=UPI00295E4638|nr:uncharacterized protein LOC132785870 [Drosophila nasuta]